MILSLQIVGLVSMVCITSVAIASFIFFILLYKQVKKQNKLLKDLINKNTTLNQDRSEFQNDINSGINESSLNNIKSIK